MEEAKQLYDRGIDDYRAGEYEEAIEALSQARSLYAEAGDRQAEAEVLNDLGVVYLQMDEWEQAQDALQTALTIRRELEDRSGQGITLGNLGMLYERQGDEEQAIQAYEQARAIFEELGEKGNEKAITRRLDHLQKGSFLERLTALLGFGSSDEEEGEDIVDVTPEAADEEN